MNANFVHFIWLMSTLSAIFCTSKHQHIGDCDYTNGYVGESDLTFICTERVNDNNFFEPYKKSSCRNQMLCEDCADGFHKFMIGTINFMDCELPKIPSNIHKVYYDVHTLNVSDIGLESLRTLASEIFFNSNHLIKLIASHNKIVEVPSHLFNGSSRISNLDLSFNKIRPLTFETFSVENHLLHLNLSFNNISDLNVKTFQRLQKLTLLTLAHNQIEEIPSFLFHKTDRIEDVDFSFNLIQQIDDYAFCGDLDLQKLNLSHNKIKNLHKKLFESLKKLEHLDLSFNEIAVLSTDLFKSLRNLEILDISHNVIKTLNADILPSKPYQLNLLAIGNNQLRELNGFTRSLVLFTKIAGIDTNPFNCTYLEKFFQTINWKQLDAVSNRINCSSVENALEFKGNGSTGAANNVEISTIPSMKESTAVNLTHIATTEKGPGSDFKAETKDITTVKTTDKTTGETTKSKEFENTSKSEEVIEKPATDEDILNKTRHRFGFSRKLWRSAHSTTQSVQSDFDAIKPYFLLIMAVMCVGFSVVVIAFIWLISRMRMLEKPQPKQIDVQYRVESSNSVENHIYDVIKFDERCAKCVEKRS